VSAHCKYRKDIGSIHAKWDAKTMTKHYFMTTIIPILLAISGAFLIIFGLVTGASFISIVFAFIVSNSPIGPTEMYVITGIFRILLAGFVKTSKMNRAGMIVAGILMVLSSICAVVFCISYDGIIAHNTYVIVIDFIIMFTLSLFYLIYAFKQARS